MTTQSLFRSTPERYGESTYRRQTGTRLPHTTQCHAGEITVPIRGTRGVKNDPTRPNGRTQTSGGSSITKDRSEYPHGATRSERGLNRGISKSRPHNSGSQGDGPTYENGPPASKMGHRAMARCRVETRVIGATTSTIATLRPPCPKYRLLPNPYSKPELLSKHTMTTQRTPPQGSQG